MVSARVESDTPFASLRIMLVIDQRHRIRDVIGVDPYFRLSAVILLSIDHSAEGVGVFECNLVVGAGYIENFKTLAVSYEPGIFFVLPWVGESYAFRRDAFLCVSMDTEH